MRTRYDVSIARAVTVVGVAGVVGLLLGVVIGGNKVRLSKTVDQGNDHVFVVSPDGLPGLQVQNGDTLEFKVLNPNDLGFTVNFPPNSGSTCVSGVPITVSYGNPGSCIVGEGAAPTPTYFNIVLNQPAPPFHPSTPGSTGVPFSVVPCRGCSNPSGGGSTSGVGSTVPTSSSGNTDMGFISCVSGQTTVNDIHPSDNGTAFWAGAGSWTVTNFQPVNPCLDGSVFATASSAANPAYSACIVNTKVKNTYTYTAQLAGCSSVTGNLLVP